MKLRAKLANEVIEALRARRFSQSKAAELLAVTQPACVSSPEGQMVGPQGIEP